MFYCSLIFKICGWIWIRPRALKTNKYPANTLTDDNIGNCTVLHSTTFTNLCSQFTTHVTICISTQILLTNQVIFTLVSRTNDLKYLIGRNIWNCCVPYNHLRRKGLVPCFLLEVIGQWLILTNIKITAKPHISRIGYGSKATYLSYSGNS